MVVFLKGMVASVIGHLRLADNEAIRSELNEKLSWVSLPVSSSPLARKNFTAALYIGLEAIYPPQSSLSERRLSFVRLEFFKITVHALKLCTQAHKKVPC